MPKIQVVFFSEDGASQVYEWLTALRRTHAAGYAQCAVRIEQLAAAGHELRRPAANYLRDGIYELRAKKGHVQYRILYFFHGRMAAVLAHALVKPGAAVPVADIERALNRKAAFERNPARHTFEKETHDS